MATYVLFEDFFMFELVPKRLRAVFGFGEMSWINVADFVSAKADPILLNAGSAITHMNESHLEDLNIMVKYLTKTFKSEPVIKKSAILEIDRFGMEIVCDVSNGRRRGRINFDSELTTSGKQLQEEIVKLSKRAKQLRHQEEEKQEEGKNNNNNSKL